MDENHKVYEFDAVKRAERKALESWAPTRSRLVGLAFSGGGIRSATFNLGILQALARCGLLSRFHYLSTVSGGGYIGSWLSGWVFHEGQRKDVRRRRTQAADRASRERRWRRMRAPSRGRSPGCATSATT